ncbi:MAG: tyrosine-type recombinase/integrase [Eubacteriales bacterium]
MDYILKLNDFETYLYDEEKSGHTVKKYIRDVKLFFESSLDNQLCKKNLLAFKEKLVREYKPRSVNSMLASINKFLEFLEEGNLKLKPIKIQKEIFTNPNTELTDAEYRRLLEAAEEIENQRLFFIIQTIGLTGIRVSELEYITINALYNGRATVICKGKQRIVLIPKYLRKLLIKYCKDNHITEGIVFKTKNGKPIDRSNIWKMMKKLCKSANVLEGKVFPHNLRHLFARTYYDIEKDINKLADILGHSNINTTRIYLMETGEDHERQIDKLSHYLLAQRNTT